MGRESPLGVRALPSVGGRTYSGPWEQFLERVKGGGGLLGREPYQVRPG